VLPKGGTLLCNFCLQVRDESAWFEPGFGRDIGSGVIDGRSQEWLVESEAVPRESIAAEI
jgi:hypothetical protein